VERKILNIDPDAKKMATWNAEVGWHATITNIAPVRKNCDVMHSTGRLVFHTEEMANGQAPLCYQCNEPLQRDMCLVVAEWVEHLLKMTDLV
jgi:hypothetical protein